MPLHQNYGTDLDGYILLLLPHSVKKGVLRPLRSRRPTERKMRDYRRGLIHSGLGAFYLSLYQMSRTLALRVLRILDI